MHLHQVVFSKTAISRVQHLSESMRPLLNYFTITFLVCAAEHEVYLKRQQLSVDVIRIYLPPK